MRQALTKILHLALDGCLEQSERHVLADHGGRLEEALLLWWEPVDPSGQQRLHARRDLDDLCVLDQLVVATLAGKSSDLHQGADALLEEERIALCPLDEEALGGSELGPVAHQGLEQLVRALRAQGLDPELTIVALTTPGVTVLWAIVDEEEHRRRGQTLHHAVEHGLRLSIDPVEVLHHEEEGLDSALAKQQALHRIERKVTALGRFELPEPVVLGQGVEKPQNGRDHILECLVQGEKMPGTLGAYRADIVTLV